jgi:molybdopterin-containing oxidoreductase family iron-sulfur binding subunit|nr:Fe-S-cluster-containing hydrogenase [Kofleriaceae bacterium]
MHDDHHDHDEHEHEHGHDDGAHDAPVAPLPPTPEYGYWKSIRELQGQAPWQLDPATGRREFPTAPAEAEPVIDPMSRRNFFHLMGASAALAGVASCQRYEKEEIVPLARRPEDQTPGQTQEYATAWELSGVGHPLIATSYEGRPIHLDGNAEHPFIAGGVVPGTKRHAGATAFVQASILHLYDPDRSKAPTKERGKGSTMDEVRDALPAIAAALKQPGARVLTEASSSDTVRRLKNQLMSANADLQWHEYESLSWDSERAGTALAFGKPMRPIAHLDRCMTIVTIDCDLFVEHPCAVVYGRDFARSRRPDGALTAMPGGKLGDMNRLWSVESTMTNTGALADHRMPLRSELCLPFTMALDAALANAAGPPSAFLKDPKTAKWIEVLASELRDNRNKAVVIAGRRQPAVVHALVARINAAIGAPGNTLDYYDAADPNRATHLESMMTLAADMKAGKVKTLVMLGGNPVYDAPADLDFATLLQQVPTSLHLSDYEDETSKLSTWHIPRSHFLESWGDVRTWDGTYTLAQPLIAPLYSTLSVVELLSLLTGKEASGEHLVHDTFDALDSDNANWRESVMNGFVSKKPPIPPQPQLQDFGAKLQLTDSQRGDTKRGQGDIEVAFHFSSNSYDGRFANNPWLWETPDFLTKVTWDNYALVGHETAQVLGLENDTMIKVTVGDKSVEVPCYTMPGQARYSIGLVLGGGRTAAGHVGGREGKVPVGYATQMVRQTTGFDIALKASVTAVGKSYELANTQDHWDYRPGILKDVGNDGIQERIPGLIREVSNEEFTKDHSWTAEKNEGFFEDTGDFGKRNRPRGLSLFEEQEYSERHRWGMTIDLQTCTGCNSCMVACQSENNVPVVGRREVINNREMSWIRIDRYFKGPPENPEVVFEPVACQQCENAPCEQVCPVGATSHSDEGLNDMAYNRCIGTRYCANNCPYKVRRFNFLDWNKEFREARMKVRRLLFNPDVTVRMRGVMEKCSYCVQRIQNAKIKWKAEVRSGQHTAFVNPNAKDAPWDLMPDGMVTTACQAACPTEAIVFGDLADPDSRVSNLQNDRRQYPLLPEMYTKPRTRYLARVRNPNPALVEGGGKSEKKQEAGR